MLPPVSEPVFRQQIPGGWVELCQGPDGWHARQHVHGQLRSNRRRYPSPVAALVTLQRGAVDDPALAALLREVDRATRTTG